MSKPFTSQLEASTGMYVVLSADGSQRIPFGRTHGAKLQAEATAALLSYDWPGVVFAGYEPPSNGASDAQIKEMAELDLAYAQRVSHLRAELKRSLQETAELRQQVLEKDRDIADLQTSLGKKPGWRR